jgi:hypothetical protein
VVSSLDPRRART